MRKLLFLVLFYSTSLVAQSNQQHVVYFETDKYEVPETEKNRLLFFIRRPTLWLRVLCKFGPRTARQPSQWPVSRHRARGSHGGKD